MSYVWLSILFSSSFQISTKQPYGFSITCHFTSGFVALQSLIPNFRNIDLVWSIKLSSLNNNRQLYSCIIYTYKLRNMSQFMCWFLVYYDLPSSPSCFFFLLLLSLTFFKCQTSYFLPLVTL